MRHVYGTVNGTFNVGQRVVVGSLCRPFVEVERVRAVRLALPTIGQPVSPELLLIVPLSIPIKPVADQVLEGGRHPVECRLLPVPAVMEDGAQDLLAFLKI